MLRVKCFFIISWLINFWTSLLQGQEFRSWQTTPQWSLICNAKEVQGLLSFLVGMENWMRSKDHKVCFFICCFPGHLSGLAEYLSHSLQRSTKGFLQYMDSCFSSNMWIFSPSTGTQNSLPFCLQFQTFCYGGGCDAHRRKFWPLPVCWYWFYQRSGPSSNLFS